MSDDIRIDNTNKNKYPLNRYTYQNLEIFESNRLVELKKIFAVFSNTLADYGGKIYGSQTHIEGEGLAKTFYIFTYYEVPKETKDEFYKEFVLKRYNVRKTEGLNEEIERLIKKYTTPE